MLRSCVPLICLVLIGCSNQEPRGDCGDSFCLPASAKFVSNKMPVEDFRFYEVEWRGERFRIYEGNHPSDSNAEGRTPLPLPGDQAASFHVAEGKGSIIIDMKKDSPAYLDVTGRCPSTQQCLVKAFAAELSLKT